LSGSSPLTRLAWEALPVAYATASIPSWDHVTTQAPPLRQSRDRYKHCCYENFSGNS
jgi:hypothetical protein